MRRLANEADHTMNQASFFFENSFNTAIAGLNTSLLTPIQTIAYMILAVTFLLGLYEAFLRQASARDLGLWLLKYVIAAVLIQQWTAFFNDVYNGFSQIASYIESSYGTGDMLANWNQQIQQWANQPDVSVWSVFSGGQVAAAAVIGFLLSALTFLVYLVAYLLFMVIYDFWGCILWVMGPLLIALMPSASLSGIAKTYARNLAEWACWPVLYAVFGCMTTAINTNTIQSILNTQNFTDVIGNSTNVIFIGILSLLYAICLVLIPFIAHYLIGGDFMGVWSAGSAVIRQAMAAQGQAATLFGGGMTAMGGAGGGGNGSYGGAPAAGSTNGDSPTSSTPPRSPANDRLFDSATADGASAGAAT
jgi:hypothetical protein